MVEANWYILLEQLDDSQKRLLAAEFAFHSLPYFYRISGGEGSINSQMLIQAVAVFKRFVQNKASLEELAQARQNALAAYLDVQGDSEGENAALAVWWASTDVAQTAVVNVASFAAKAAAVISPAAKEAEEAWQRRKLAEFLGEKSGSGSAV